MSRSTSARRHGLAAERPSTIPETTPVPLVHRNPARLKEMIEARHGQVVGLSEQTVQGWIDPAKAHE